MKRLNLTRLSVIPAKAGIHCDVSAEQTIEVNACEVWVPASAGMTAGGGRRYVS
jgi:hypothetical protein